MPNRIHMLVRVVFSALIALVFVACAEACPTCKEALGNNNGSLVRGFGWSIIFMMSVPFLILAGIGSYFFYEIRKARAKAEPRLTTANLRQ